MQKCGFLRVYSGKNPLTDLPHGSWKRFWARLDREKDQDQLTFLLFEHEKKSRPKVVHKLHHATSAFAKCGNSLFNKEVLGYWCKSSIIFFIYHFYSFKLLLNTIKEILYAPIRKVINNHHSDLAGF